MPPRHSIEPKRAQRGSPRPKMKPIVASAATIALGVSGVFLAAVPASAAPGYSEAEARFLSGSLLDLSLDELAAVAGERAVANGETEQVVTESGDLDLSVLGDVLQLQVADGVTIPLTVADAGVLSQYAQASQSGASRAATGAITDQGIIDLDAAADAPAPLTFELTDLIGDDLATAVADASLTAGVTTATADQAAAGAPTGDYNIAGLELNLTSPILSALSADLVASGEALDGTVAEALGADGSLVDDLTGALSGLGLTTVDLSAETDLSAVVEGTLEANTVLGADGPVQVDLTTGEVTADIAAVLAANGRDLNDLAPGEEILDTELVGFITADVDELVSGLLGEVQSSVSTALAATDLTLSAGVTGDDGPFLALNLAGTLEEISTGAAVPELELFGNEFDAALLSGPIGAAVGDALALELNTEALDTDLAPLYPALDSVLSELVSLRANLQETEEGTFTETALRLEVLNYTADGEALALNLAQAAVGPNAVPTEDPAPAAPGILGLTPILGPELGGTEVTITGTDLTAVDTVSFGGVAGTELTVVSPTELTVLTPAGVGLVDVTVSGPTGSATLQDAFNYVPAESGAEIGTVISFSPTSGPEDGGTPVTIIGTGFTGADGVDFGGTPGTDFTVVSDNEITVVSPPGVGAATLTVTGAPNGDIVASEAFVYIPESSGGIATIVGTVSPTTGPEAGGTPVTITGSGFDIIDEVRFDGIPGTALTVNSDNELTVVTPAGTGQVLITLVDTATEGGGSVTASVPFSYFPAVEIPAPTIGAVTPDSGSSEGGTVVTIVGENFTEGDTVSFGGVPATEVEIISDTEIRATTPAGTGVVDVVVDRGDGEAATFPGGFTYIAPSAPISGEENGADNGGNADNGNGGGFAATDGGVALDGGEPQYANCDAAEAAGQVNFQSSDRNLDRDGDGIACEGDGNGAGEGADRNLAFTGSQGVQGVALGGILMILLGGAAFIIRRRLAS